MRHPKKSRGYSKSWGVASRVFDREKFSRCQLPFYTPQAYSRACILRIRWRIQVNELQRREHRDSLHPICAGSWWARPAFAMWMLRCRKGRSTRAWNAIHKGTRTRMLLHDRLGRNARCDAGIVWIVNNSSAVTIGDLSSRRNHSFNRFLI